MADPHLDSIHLPAPRREDFRAARRAVLDACGPRTLAGQIPGPDNSLATDAGDNSDAPSGSRFVLVERDQAYPLRLGLNTVGRLPDNDVVINDPYVSRRHCVIVVHAGNGCELYDVASRNGTKLNGQPLQGAAQLHNGDQIGLCDRRLTLLARETRAEPGGHTLVLD
jgi:pSer/pThr/pTyr-binding forkhead associated (FHA) protein